MRIAALALAGTLALASCNNEPDVKMENASVAEVQQELKRQGGGEERFVNPGRWEQKMTMLEMDVPGMPAEMKNRMQQVMAGGQTFDSCLTPEEAKRPREEFFAGDAKNCRYDRFNWGGGKVDVAMNCESEGRRQAMNLTGSYTPDAYNLQMQMRANGGADAGPMANMTMRMQVVARRVGECTGTEQS
jgi:hypothetical protein